MKKVLVIGSSVCDIVINLMDHLPTTGEDVHAGSQHMSLGGCAYNVSDMLRHFHVPYVLFSPTGTGLYGDFVRNSLRKRGITSPIPTPDMENGCCYCFVDSKGERSFISYHGAEYRFLPEWFSLLDAEEFDTVYICGLEIEEETGENIVAFLEEHPSLQIYFAPGPRAARIFRNLFSRICSLSPILHLNEKEAVDLTGVPVYRDAAVSLYEKTKNIVIITLADQGCYYYDGVHSALIPSFPAVQVDTIGAGDAHIGAVIASRKLGVSLSTAIETANRIAAAVVEVSGALLPDEAFDTAF